MQYWQFFSEDWYGPIKSIPTNSNRNFIFIELRKTKRWKSNGTTDTYQATTYHSIKQRNCRKRQFWITLEKLLQ